jgi:hypothetical protein
VCEEAKVLSRTAQQREQKEEGISVTRTGTLVVIPQTGFKIKTPKNETENT